MQLCFPNHVAPQRFWRLNPCLLTDEDFMNYISTNSDIFLETNWQSGTSMGTLWEAMKAYLCGQVISYTISMNRRRTKRMTELVGLIRDINKRHSTTSSAALYTHHVAVGIRLFGIRSRGGPIPEI